MSTGHEDWIRLLLEEIRKNNDKIDSVKDHTSVKIAQLEKEIDNRLDKSETQHLRLLEAQERMVEQHQRMNDLLEEHMRRTVANEKLIEIQQQKLEEHKAAIKPIMTAHLEQEALKKRSSANLKRTSIYIGMTGGVLGAIATLLKFFDLI